MTEFLLEVFSEEIPARMQAKAAEDLKTLLVKGLEKAGITPENPRCFVTPRRLTVVMEGLPLSQPDVKEERKGPKVDAPEKAIEGFLRATGLTLDQCEQRDTPKGPVYFAVIEKKGRETIEVLPEIIVEALANLPWPKSMRWGTNPTRWVRPLHRIVALLNGRQIDVEYAGVKAGAETEGHRFLAPEPFPVGDFDSYREKLTSAYVMLDPEERRRVIRTEAQRLCESEGLKLKEDEGLLREVMGLVEWPVVMMGRIDDEFMDVPEEVLTTSMRSHQKYFSVNTKDGALAPRFVVVSNMIAEDGGQAIIAGNERVLRARLSDAKFFWDQDRKQPLEKRVDGLKDRVFHAQLGTEYDKVQRIRKLAGEIAAPMISANQLELVDRAAALCKADLPTGMVGEFPELQGIMGRYYALHDGEAPAVADAIASHYSPLGPNDECPQAMVSVAVALADKIDTLAGFWAIDQKPTGSKDPYALRRAALGVIRLIRENNLRISLGQIARHALLAHIECLLHEIATDASNPGIGAGSPESYGEMWLETPPSVLIKGTELERQLIVASRALEIPEEEYEAAQNISSRLLRQFYENLMRLFSEDAGERGRAGEYFDAKIKSYVSDFLDFFADRLKVHLREQGVRHDLVTAVFALGGEDDLVRLLARVDALSGFLETEDGANLLVAYRRSSNILRIEEKKDGVSYSGAVNADALALPQEQALAAALDSVEPAARQAIAEEDFANAMAALARLRAPVDAFFDDVTVNAEDSKLRENRLRLLSRITAVMGEVADFSKIEG
ncbi:Glycyl-tRNA synthetase beta chain [Caenispirillum salinarum AK4]|uniref:Glycine--tRNA ligase beta subunit n=1 Tax=Caenispirillum salinarum AK4 TaxID=1238182 RepID=K9GVI2_9PROT|nr:glycine--tRNA ligase subunit beta [Caenispirillum salinarum]EKV29197.1 Glycyl-tRNA synthetase beta chain [Caenispirillum salinarum AK4]